MSEKTVTMKDLFGKLLNIESKLDANDIEVREIKLKVDRIWRVVMLLLALFLLLFPIYIKETRDFLVASVSRIFMP